MLFVCQPKILHKYCLQFLLGVKMAPRENENNAYAKFWGDKQRALWYVMVFSGVVNSLRARTPLSLYSEGACTAPIRSVYSRTSNMYLLPFNSAISHYIWLLRLICTLYSLVPFFVLSLDTTKILQRVLAYIGLQWPYSRKLTGQLTGWVNNGKYKKIFHIPL